jgi:hypothetical protein
MVNVQLQNGDAYIVCCKHHNHTKKKCKSNLTNCALHCYGHKLIKEEASLDNVQGVVILYIIPEEEDLKPPINDEETETVDGKYILYNDKLFKLHDNERDGLCLLDSLSSSFCNVYSTAPEVIVCRPNFFDNNHEKGYDLPHVIQFLTEFLCTLSEKDFDAILINYHDGDDLPEPTLSSEYKKFTKKIGSDIKLPPMEEGK